MQTDINTIAAELAGNLSLDELRRRQSADFAERYRKPVPEFAKAAAREYWTEVFSEKPKQENMIHARRFEQEMAYEDARVKFWRILQMRAAHIAMLKNNEKWDWNYHEHFVANIRAILKWAINDPTGPLPLHKGLFLYGAPGTGKTELLQALAKFLKQENLSKQFYFSVMSEEYDRTRTDEKYNPRASNLQFDRAFDEFGRYTGPVLRFGDPLDVNECIVEARYVRFQRYGQLTHFTSNVTPNQLEGLVSAMLLDRIASMCSSVFFTGTSLRDYNPA